MLTMYLTQTVAHLYTLSCISTVQYNKIYCLATLVRKRKLDYILICLCKPCVWSLVHSKQLHRVATLQWDLSHTAVGVNGHQRK